MEPSPAQITEAAASPAEAGPVCPVCQAAVGVGEDSTLCPACRTRYHRECWEYNKGCGLYGCVHAPPAEPREALEIPVSFWGQEEKTCPSCEQTILAAAIRCRHCGAVFTSSKPQEKAEFARRADTERNLPRVRRQIVWLLIFSILSCTAPLAAVVGWIWRARHHAELKTLPALHAALTTIALAVATGQTAVMLAVVVWFKTMGR